jgi:EmrB/QacA subfamily drug resistance transporter
VTLTDQPSAPPAPPAPPPAFRWTRVHVVTLTVVCFAQLLEAIDITVVNVALPTIRTDLHFSAAGLQWVVNAYTVLFGGFLLLGGRAGDLLGRRRVFLAGVAAFTLASLASGLATNAGTLVATRAAQGLAAGFVAPMTLAILTAAFPEGRPRNRALGVWGATAGISASLGLLVGGLIVSGPGWRWIFFVNIPIGALMLLAGWRYVADDRAAARPERRYRHFDTAGAVTVTAGLILLAYGVVQTDTHPWGSARTLLLLAAAAALLGYFVVREAWAADEPLVPFSLFANRAVTGANVMSALQGAGTLAVFYFTTLYMQEVLHFSALKTGLAYLPLTGTLVVLSGLGPVLVPRIGIRYTLALGFGVAAVGLGLFARVSAHGTLVPDIVVPSVVLAAGLALTFVPITIGAVTGVSPARAGLASGMVNVTRTVGGALGLAVIATVATRRGTHLAHTGHAPGDALTGGFRLGFAICAVLMAVSALTAILLFRREGRGAPVNLTELAAAGLET